MLLWDLKEIRNGRYITHDAVSRCPECKESFKNMRPEEIDEHIDNELRKLYSKKGDIPTSRITELERTRKKAIHGDAMFSKGDSVKVTRGQFSGKSGTIVSASGRYALVDINGKEVSIDVSNLSKE